MRTVHHSILAIALAAGAAVAGVRLTDGTYTGTPTGGEGEEFTVSGAGDTVTWDDKTYTWDPDPLGGGGSYRWRDEEGDWHYLTFNGSFQAGTYDDSDVSGTNNGTYQRTGA